MIVRKEEFVDSRLYNLTVVAHRMTQKFGFLVVGLDEVGRGPLAGPVAAGAVCFPPRYANVAIRDSKQLTAKRREELFDVIKEAALSYAVVCVGPRRIERLNIREASRLAMLLAAERVQRELERSSSFEKLIFFIDGNVPLAGNLFQETIIKGDQKILCIQAASIMAKVTRDRLMMQLDQFYPGYEFSVHKGYPTQIHSLRLREKGPCRIHRRTFAGVSPSFSAL